MDGYEEDETYVIKDFTPDRKAVPYPTILLVGKRSSGKSTTSVAIAKQFDVARWSAWCGTKETEDFWAQKFGSSACVWGPNEAGKAALSRIIKYQQKKVRLYKEVLKKPFPEELKIGMVFDDVTAKREFRKGEILEDLFSNGRHYKAVIIISCQYIKQLPPAVRTNTDYLFMLHSTKRTCKILYEEYVENPDEFAMFMKLLRAVTSQTNANGKEMYNSLVYNNCVKSYRLDEMFSIYRHVEEFNPDDVELGSGVWRKYNATHFRDHVKEIAKKEHKEKQRRRRLKSFVKDREEERKDLDNELSSSISSDDTTSDEDTECVHIGSKHGRNINLIMSNHSARTVTLDPTNQPG